MKKKRDYAREYQRRLERNAKFPKSVARGHAGKNQQSIRQIAEGAVVALRRGKRAFESWRDKSGIDVEMFAAIFSRFRGGTKHDAFSLWFSP